MKKILPAIMSLLITAGATAQETVKLSMKDCMEYALKHNYSIRNSQLDVRIQDEQNKQTLAAAYPHINGKAEFDDFLNPTATFIESRTFVPTAPAGQISSFSFSLPYAASASISGSQLLFDGSVFIALKARNTLMEFSKLNGAITEENVRYNVYKAYNSLVIAYRQYDIIKSSLTYARSLEHDLEITRQNGFAEKIDVERTSVQVNNLATDSLRIGNMLTLSEQMLKFQMGMDIRTPIVLTDTALEAQRVTTAQILNTDGAYDRIPEYNVLTTTLRLNEFNLKRYQLAGLPSINVFGATGYNYGAIKFAKAFRFQDYAFNSMIGVTLSVPIYNGSLRHNQVIEAQLNVEKSKNSIENLKQTIDFQTATSRTSLRNTILQAQSQRRNIDMSNDVLDLAQRKYKAGVGSNLEVTQAQTDQLRAQTNYFSALLEVINAEADLKKALGLLKQ
jgi:outer membrane protein